MLNLHWIALGQGNLALWHRFGRADISALPGTGCTRVVTILSEKEGGARMGQAVQELGLEWTWLQVGNGRYPQGEAHDILLNALPVLSQQLDAGESIVIHCSAGIHRTGMLSYALLRWRGYIEIEALNMIGQMRVQTREGIQRVQISWGNAIVENRPAPKAA
jgi:hypothetical protein